MKILEYEAKQLLQNFNISVPNSSVLSSSGGTGFFPSILKSQVATGGRGKLGGVIAVDNQAELNDAASRLFELPIKGLISKTLLLEERLNIKEEFYLSLLLNRNSSSIELIAHRSGGIEIESNDTASFLCIDMVGADFDAIGQSLADYYDLSEQTFALQDLVENLYSCFRNSDATLLEINPLILTEEGQLVAGDCKMTLDDAAAFRHPEWDFENNSTEANFVTLDKEGEVATIANGAGLAMATVDAVADFGVTPANFLDIGGGANSQAVLDSFYKIMQFSEVKGIIINIFAGITRCDEVAKAIIEAQASIAKLPPLFIRISGTNETEAKKTLSKHGIPLLPTLKACVEEAKKEVNRG